MADKSARQVQRSDTRARRNQTGKAGTRSVQVAAQTPRRHAESSSQCNLKHNCRVTSTGRSCRAEDSTTGQRRKRGPADGRCNWVVMAVWIRGSKSQRPRTAGVETAFCTVNEGSGVFGQSETRILTWFLH